MQKIAEVMCRNWFQRPESATRLGIYVALMFGVCCLHWAWLMSSNIVVAHHGGQILPQQDHSKLDVAKPTGLFAFLLCLCHLALYSLRTKIKRCKGRGCKEAASASVGC